MFVYIFHIIFVEFLKDLLKAGIHNFKKRIFSLRRGKKRNLRFISGSSMPDLFVSCIMEVKDGLLGFVEVISRTGTFLPD